jgi:UDP-MurNAc hydroxylase
MQITWVNHASFILQSGNVRLICDPWIEGRTFNDGWQLTSPTRMRYEDFVEITHIWFSHEHPDHFLPPNLKRIPESIRRNITVLFHETRDKRVVKVCQSLGFTVRELPNLQSVQIAPDFKVVCGLNDLIDSWIAIFAEGKTILNLNDCVFPAREELVSIRLMTGEVDLLLSQFSYANWVGNPDDQASQQYSAREKREQMTEQIDVTRPRQFIPFASFVFFCHQENFFMNRSVNHIGETYRYLTHDRHQETVVLYPGDRWQVGKPHDSADAIRHYQSDLKIALAAAPVTSKPADLDTLNEAMRKLTAKCLSTNNRLMLNAIPSSVVRLSDLGKDVEISFRKGLREVTGKQPDIIASSNSLLYCLTTDWGGDTLKINGRFEAPVGGMVNRFFQIFRVPQYNSYGSSLNFKFVAGRLMDRVRRATASSSF